MNERILLISTPASDITDLKRTLSRCEQYQLVCIDKQLVEPHLVGQFGAVILDYHLFDRQAFATLSELSTGADKSRFLVLANQITIYSYRQIDLLKNVIALQKPFSPELFLTVIHRLAQDEDFCPAPRSRFITDESVRVVDLKSGVIIPTRMRNYSSGGAFLEYRGIALKVGDRVQMNLMKRSAPKENLQIEAKVIWIRNGDHPRSPCRGVGIQFLNQPSF